VGKRLAQESTFKNVERQRVLQMFQNNVRRHRLKSRPLNVVQWASVYKSPLKTRGQSYQEGTTISAQAIQDLLILLTTVGVEIKLNNHQFYRRPINLPLGYPGVLLNILYQVVDFGVDDQRLESYSECMQFSNRVTPLINSLLN
jgi:hypothetical protein